MAPQNILNRLNKAFFLRSKISHYPVPHNIIPQPDGLSVVLFENTDDLEEFCKLIDIESLDDFEIDKVNSIFDRCVEFAQMGYVGIWFYNNFPLFFANRFSEYNCDLPTIGYYLNADERTWTYFGASGILAKIKEVRDWKNYYYTDRLIRKYYSDFYANYANHINKFFLVKEVSKFDKPVVIGDSPLHGPYTSPDGVIPVFSDIEFAKEFIQYLSSKWDGDFTLIPIDNLTNHFNTNESTFRGLPYDICLNPHSPRFMQGYFYYHNTNWFLKNVWNVYLVEGNLISETEDPHLIPTYKSDTIDNSSQLDPIETILRPIVKFPLKRILNNTGVKLSFREAQDVVESEINESFFAKQDHWAKEIEPDQIGQDCFLVFGFDKISGNPFSNDGLSNTPYAFSDIFEACSFFYHKLMPFDYEIRIEGYANPPWRVEGSKDPELESFRLEEGRLGIKRLMEDILIEGYKPHFAGLLKKYINESTVVLEIEQCGYLADLSYYKNEYIDEYLSDVEDIEDSKIIKRIVKMLRSSKYKPELNYNIQQKIKRHLGKSEEFLDDESRMMLETAIIDFQEKGVSETIDYAPISMELCKVFERELKRNIFQKWKNKHYSGSREELKSMLDEYHEDFTLQKLVKWLLGKGKIELGSMKYIISRSNKEANLGIFQELHKYIISLINGEYILSEEFANTLTKISTKYRNGGVHEHMVTYKTCEEAFNEILLGPNSALKKLGSME